MIDAGRLPDVEFRSLLAEWKLTVMCNELSQAETSAADPACPPHWRNAFDQYQRTFRRSVMRPDYFVPIEFKTGTVDDGFARAQKFVGQFGELLTWWPEIWEAALRMNCERRDTASVTSRPGRLP